MQKILILVGRSASNINSFCTKLSELLPKDYEVEKAYFEDILIDIEDKNTYITINGKDISTYDLVYFRRAGAEFLWLAATIALYLDSRNVIYYDSAYRDSGIGNKLYSLVNLAINGLPVIPTMFCYKGNIISNADSIIEKLGLPLVVKDLHSQRGLGVFLIKEKADIVKIATDNPGKRYMFQKFINKKEEYRVLVLGETVGSYEVKTSTDPNEFRNNVSLGAKEDFKEISSMTEEVKYVSIKSARVLRIEVAGVDIVLDTDENVWVLEVNRGPGFTYDSKDSPEMDSVSKYFQKTLSKGVVQQMNKKVGICFSKELTGDTPLSHITTKLPVYIRLLTLMQKEGWEVFVLTRKTYRGNGIFEGGWVFDNGKFVLTKEKLKIDLVFDRTGGIDFPLSGDNLTVVNEREFKVLAWDKWAAYQIIGEYMPKTFLVENENEIPGVIAKIGTDKVVLKPFNGLKGLGVFVGEKVDAVNFKFPEKFKKYIAQEFIDTSGGIPNVTSGLHDLRVAIVNGNPVWCHVRVPAEGTYLANAAQGGNLTEVDYAKVPNSIKQVVKKVSSQFSVRYDNPIYSLDFGIDKDCTPKIFEINDQMGFPKWEMEKRDAFLEGLIANFRAKMALIK